MAQTTSFTSSATGSAAIYLNPVPKSTTITLTSTTPNTTAGSSNATFRVDYTVDDPSALGAGTTTWALLSSGATIASTDIAPSLSWTVLSPIAGVRLVCVAASTAAATFYNFQLHALQSVTA